MPCASFQAVCLARRRSVSSIARRRLLVIASAYRIDAPVDVARGAADGLDQAGLRAQKPLLVGVQDGDQRAFRDVEPLAQQVDADQHVEDPEPQVADDVDALQRLDVGVEIADLDAVLGQVLGQVLRHALGERRDQHAAALCGDGAALGEQVVDLPLHRPDLGHGVDQPGRADHLLGEHAVRCAPFPKGRASR